MKENLKRIAVASTGEISEDIMQRLKELDVEIVDVDSLDLSERYAMPIEKPVVPKIQVLGESKKKKKCTYHEYTERENKKWLCRHCEHPLK